MVSCFKFDFFRNIQFLIGRVRRAEGPPSNLLKTVSPVSARLAPNTTNLSGYLKNKYYYTFN